MRCSNSSVENLSFGSVTKSKSKSKLRRNELGGLYRLGSRDGGTTDPYNCNVEVMKRMGNGRETEN